MKVVALALLVLLLLAAGGFTLRRLWRRRREYREQQQAFRAELSNIRTAVEQFEKTTDFDEQIRLLADIVRYCSTGFRVFPDHAEIMNIARACEDERRKLAQHWAVAESQRLMKLVEDSANLRVKAGRADQVAESLKVASRLLFPHEKITNAMRSVVQYQEALEGSLELPETQRAEVAEGARTLLEPYLVIMRELTDENQELARVPWAGPSIRQTLERLEKI